MKRTLAAKAVYFTGPYSIDVKNETFSVDEDEIVVESELMAISHGTEMLLYRGLMPAEIEADANIEALSGKLSYPLKYGYSNVGVTAGGERVFVFYPHQDRFAVCDSECVRLPPDMAVEDAVFIPNTETALAIVQDLEPVAGELIGIIGGGVVGLLVAEILKRGFFGDVFVVEKHRERASFAEQIGFRCFDPLDPLLREWIADRSSGIGADRIVDASGCASGMQLGIDLLGYSGLLIEASWFGTQHIPLQLGSAFHRQRITVRSVQVSSISPALLSRWTKNRRMETVLRLVSELEPGKLISHRIELERSAEAFKLIDSKPESTLQVVLTP